MTTEAANAFPNMSDIAQVISHNYQIQQAPALNVPLVLTMAGSLIGLLLVSISTMLITS